MPEYRVRVEIDVIADSHRLAAREAYQLLRAPDCSPWFCEVKEARAAREEEDQHSGDSMPWLGFDLETDLEEGSQ
jgi:hypothetical protein